MFIPEWQTRTRLLLGEDSLRKLSKAHVLVAGLGGVGAYTAELLCRAGVGRLTIADKDKIQSSNRNRQLIALKSNEGQDKVELMGARLMDINPLLGLSTVNELLKDQQIEMLLETRFDYIVDAIDTLSPKITLISKSLEKDYPIVSSMGSGGKLDPMQVKISDISESFNCRLAYNIRKHLHKMGIRNGFKVVFSTEKVSREAVEHSSDERFKRSTVGTISYMPPLFGCIMASVVIQDLIGTDTNKLFKNDINIFD